VLADMIGADVRDDERFAAATLAAAALLNLTK
jgi:hypothetical protein